MRPSFPFPFFSASLCCLLVFLAACDDSSGGSSAGSGGAAGSAGSAGSTSSAGSAGSAGSCGPAGGAGCGSDIGVQYLGTPIIEKAAWSAGQPVKISVKGGNLRTGSAASTSITVNTYAQAGAPAGCDQAQVCAQFTPINNDTQANKDEATRQMKQVKDGGNLLTTITNVGSEVQIAVDQDGTNGSYGKALSATVDVWVPSGFDGDIIASSESGDVSIRGAKRGALVKTGLGDIAFDLDGVTVGASGGSLLTGNGDITFNLPPGGANLNVAAQATGPGGKVGLSGAIGAWKQQPGSTDASATFCGGTACDGKTDGNKSAVSGNDWGLSTELGDIVIVVR